MNETTALARTSLVPESRPSGENDAAFVELWLGTRVSVHTRRAYRSEIDRFRHAMDKPLAWVTMVDLQAYAEQLGQGSHNRRRRTGAAVKLRPNPDGLAQRILEESEVARLIDQVPPVAASMSETGAKPLIRGTALSR